MRDYTGFLIIALSGWVGFIHFMDAKSWWALPILILWIGGSLAWLLLTESKKCPDCSKKCRTTGVAGSEYKQWYCKHCMKTFWTTLILEDYEWVAKKNKRKK